MSRRWVDTLPEVNITDLDVTAIVVQDLGLAMEYLGEDDDRYALVMVRRAAALVRAQRKTLPDQAERSAVRYRLDDRTLVRAATQAVMTADMAGTAGFLRLAEAYLRLLGKRLMERVEPKPEPVKCPPSPAVEAIAEAADQFETALGTYPRGL